MRVARSSKPGRIIPDMGQAAHWSRGTTASGILLPSCEKNVHKETDIPGRRPGMTWSLKGWRVLAALRVEGSLCYLVGEKDVELKIAWPSWRTSRTVAVIFFGMAKGGEAPEAEVQTLKLCC